MNFWNTTFSGFYSSANNVHGINLVGKIEYFSLFNNVILNFFLLDPFSLGSHIFRNQISPYDIEGKNRDLRIILSFF